LNVALVIVNFHKAARVVEGIRSIRRQDATADLRIVVVDNSVSQHESDILRAEIGQGGDLVSAPENLGYAGGVNLGARVAGAFDYILLASPDILVMDTHAIQKMVSLMEANPAIGVLATVQHNDDGSIVEVARRFPSPIHLLRRRLIRGTSKDYYLLEPLASKNSGGIIDVDWVQSSFVMVRRSLWDAIGGLDERYFVFMSDIDLCRRAHERGMRVVLTSTVDVQADGVRASRGGLLAIFHSKALRIHVRDAFVYYLRYGLSRSIGGAHRA
jgi:N-acetylglucosaminyl-diphospho-decaprenol L-rhamnosyltransferase